MIADFGENTGRMQVKLITEKTENMRKILGMIIAVLANCLMGGVLASMIGLDPVAGATIMNSVALIGGMAPGAVYLRAGVYTEIWTGELVKQLRGKLEGTWLDGIPDASSIVENDVIHLVDVGVDPDVLINNTTYPIDLQTLDDADITISLDKFQTKVTPITDDELYAVSYDKMARVKEAHANSINDAKFKKAAHAMCPESNSTGSILKTSGEAAEDGRLKMTLADLINMKREMDKLGVPADNRRLVLCPDNVNDLLESDQNFREQYNINRADGTLGKMYGFDIYEFGATPFYYDGVKRKVDTDPESVSCHRCSFAFYVPRVFKATGSTKMYYSEASTDPEYQRNKINFRHMFIAMPKKMDTSVVMVDGHEN